MAIVWGPYALTSGGAGLRLGVDTTYSAVTATSPTCVVTFKVYTDNRSSYNDNQTLTYGGTAGVTGTKGFSNNSGASSGPVLRDTKTWVYTYPADGSTVSRTFTATLSGAFNNVTPTVTVTATPPRRGVAPPTTSPPVGTVTATRDSDSQITITWPAPPSTVTSMSIARQEFVSGWSSWFPPAQLAGRPTTHVSTGLLPNRLYRYQVRTNTGSAAGPWSQSGIVWMTPAAPSQVRATPTSGGVTLTWRVNNYWTNQSDPGTRVTTTIERTTDGGASWTPLVTDFVATVGTPTWTDPTPTDPTGNTQYRITVSSPPGSNGGHPVTSAPALSNIIGPATPPAAPTGLTPDSAVNGVDLDYPVIFSWTYRPGSDLAGQTRFVIQFSTDGGTTWGLDRDVASGLSTYTLPGGTLDNHVADPLLWRVATQGTPALGLGAWSEPATIKPSPGGVILLDPDWPGPETYSYPVEARWTWSHPGDVYPVSTTVQLVNSVGQVIEETTIFTTGNPADGNAVIPDHYQFAYKPADGEVVTVRINGLFSDWQTSPRLEATTQFLAIPPARAVVSTSFEECRGMLVLDLEGALPEEGVTLDAVSVDVERQDSEGVWVPVVVGAPLPCSILDNQAVLNGPNAYRITTMSRTPTFSIQEETVLLDHGRMPGESYGSGPWGYLTWGPGFVNVLRARGTLVSSSQSSRSHSIQPLLGRTLPIALFGESVARTYSVSATINEPSGLCDEEVDLCSFDSPRSDWEAAAWAADIVCWRDYTGARVYAALGTVSIGALTLLGNYSLSFDLTQIEHLSQIVPLSAQITPPPPPVESTVT